MTALLSEGSTLFLFLLSASFLWIPAASVLGEYMGKVGVWVVYGSIVGNVVLSVVQTVQVWRRLVRRFQRVMAQVKEARASEITTSSRPPRAL